MNIVLFGFKGCGKTTIGKLLADKSVMQFVDIDLIIENLYFDRHHTKLAVRKIYINVGEESFRQLEKEAVLSLANLNNAVIAIGGGSVLDIDNIAQLKKLGMLVYLQADKSVIKQRILSASLPAFLDPEDPEGSFEKMYQSRKDIYENIVAIVISTKSMDNEVIVEKILNEAKRVKHGE